MSDNILLSSTYLTTFPKLPKGKNARKCQHLKTNVIPKLLYASEKGYQRAMPPLSNRYKLSDWQDKPQFHSIMRARWASKN